MAFGFGGTDRGWMILDQVPWYAHVNAVPVRCGEEQGYLQGLIQVSESAICNERLRVFEVLMRMFRCLYRWKVF